MAYLTLFALGLLDNARGPYFADIIDELKLSHTRAALFFVVTSTMAFFSGRSVPKLVHNLGLIQVLRIGLVVMGVGFASISLASGLSSLIFTAAIFGWGFGIINVVQNLLLITAADGDMRRRLLSGLHGMYAFASLVSPLVAAQLFTMNVSWRWAFVGFSGITAAVFMATFVLTQKIRLISTSEGNQKNPSRKSYWLVSAFISFYVMAELVVSTRLTLYLRRVHEFSAATASLYLAGFFLLLLAGRLYLLFQSVRYTSLQLIEASLILSFLSFILGLVFHPLFLVLCGFTMSPVFGLSIELLVQIFSRYATDAIASTLAISCLYIVSMHFAMGLLADAIGIQLAMYVGVAFLALSWVLLRIFLKSNLAKQ